MPKALEDKFNLKDGKYPTWRILTDNIRQRHELKRQLQIADTLHRNKGIPGSSRSGGINALADAHRAYADLLSSKAPPGVRCDEGGLPCRATGTPSKATTTIEDLAKMVNALASGSGRRPPRTDRTDPKNQQKARVMRKRSNCW